MEQRHGFGYARRIGLDGVFQALDLPLLPIFHGRRFKPAHPEQYVDGTHITLRRECLCRGPSGAIDQRGTALSAHILQRKLLSGIEVSDAG
jgi:hypothetical protein